MRRIFAAIAFVLTATACQPTGHPRCDTLLHGQQAGIEAAGWRLDCAPTFPPVGYEDGRQFPIHGWADANTRTIWLWPDLMSDRQLRKTAQHELAHIVHPGFTEAEADGWAWCTDPLQGIGYRWQPTAAECMHPAVTIRPSQRQGISQGE